ncbi:MAG: Rpn family recombination-promoting nuclease/putative transposase [Treponema sp.]|nr:Rpn family recombination-promoting nuclease/putative transposase [Treponema sp.]
MIKLPMDADLLPPNDDRIFKTLLTHPDAKQVLIDVVSSVIERTVTDVQVRNIEMPVMDNNEKSERFDVNCSVENGDQVDVEMHCSERVEIGETKKSFLNKYIYYLTDLHSSQKSKGVKYKDLVRTYQATFSMHTVFSSSPGFIHRFSLRKETGEQLSDQINMVIIELSKLNDVMKKPVEQLTSFEMWSIFFKFASDPMQRRLLNDIIQVKEEIGMATALLQEISRDEHERARLRSRRMYETDRISDLLTAEERGEIRGKAEGIAEGKAEIITLLEKGLSLEEIKKTYA